MKQEHETAPIAPAPAASQEHGGESIADLIRNLATDLSTLLGKEIELAQSEIGGSVTEAKTAVGAIATGAAMAMAGRSLKDALGHTTAKSQDKAAAVGDRVHGATANAKASAQNARDSLVQFYRDQPLLAGSLGIAIGAALGALVPPTEIEDDMLGEARDRSVDTVKSEAAGKYGEVREAARSE